MYYTQYGPITNGSVRTRSDAASCYRTILHVHKGPLMQDWVLRLDIKSCQPVSVQLHDLDHASQEVVGTLRLESVNLTIPCSGAASGSKLRVCVM
jgi:hypothetical protein